MLNGWWCEPRESPGDSDLRSRELRRALRFEAGEDGPEELELEEDEEHEELCTGAEEDVDVCVLAALNGKVRPDWGHDMMRRARCTDKLSNKLHTRPPHATFTESGVTRSDD